MLIEVSFSFDMILLGFVFYSEGFRGRTSLFCLLRAQNCSTAGILPPARRQCNLHKNGSFPVSVKKDSSPAFCSELPRVDHTFALPIPSIAHFSSEVCEEWHTIFISSDLCATDFSFFS